MLIGAFRLFAEESFPLTLQSWIFRVPGVVSSQLQCTELLQNYRGAAACGMGIGSTEWCAAHWAMSGAGGRVHCQCQNQQVTSQGRGAVSMSVEQLKEVGSETGTFKLLSWARSECPGLSWTKGPGIQQWEHGLVSLVRLLCAIEAW